ncbi:MAG: hypothetical protein R3C05_00500 [Pirellulaceae bacterium]
MPRLSAVRPPTGGRTAERSDGLANASLANNLIHRTGQARWGLIRTTLVNQMRGK